MVHPPLIARYNTFHARRYKLRPACPMLVPLYHRMHAIGARAATSRQRFFSAREDRLLPVYQDGFLSSKIGRLSFEWYVAFR